MHCSVQHNQILILSTCCLGMRCMAPLLHTQIVSPRDVQWNTQIVSPRDVQCNAQIVSPRDVQCNTQIVSPRDMQCNTGLKKSMLQLQRMASLTEQDSLQERGSILPKLPTTDTSAPKQIFSQHKTKPVGSPGNFHPKTKASSDFKTHYVPAFSSFQGYQRSILRAKQKREMKEAVKGKQGAGKSHKALVCR